MPSLAVFDLDQTLLDGDSDYLWGRFLIAQGLVDAEIYETANQRFYDEYLRGELDIHAFAEFSMAPLTRIKTARLLSLRERFVAEEIIPRVAAGTPALLAAHRAAGDSLLITTATNRFITEPIAELLGIANLIATDPEMHDGAFTGRIAGLPNFREGKVIRLRSWLAAQPQAFTHLSCYSDSRNDIPLLELADMAFAVDPDPALRAEAATRGWSIISLRA